MRSSTRLLSLGSRPSSMGLALVLTTLAGAAGARPFDGATSTYAQTTYVKDDVPVFDGEFGRALAMDGDTLAIGVENDTTGVPFAGLVYIYVRSGSGWSREATLRASNEGGADWFGLALAIEGDTLVVGAPYEDGSATGVDGPDDDEETDAGAAYVFVRNGTSWSQQAYLKASNTGDRDMFATSVAISGNTIVVGAPREDGSATGIDGVDDDAAQWAGAAYVFTFDGTDWSQQAYLKASNTAPSYNFGSSVTLAGDTIAIGSTGESSAATGVNGDQNLCCANGSGAAYVFERSGSTWQQQAYLKATNTGSLNRFGASIALSGDTLAVGADWQFQLSGAVYTYQRNGANWTTGAFIKALDATPGDEFGSSLWLADGLLVVGAEEADSSTGAAYVFTPTDTGYVQTRLQPFNAEQDDWFGWSVTGSGTTVVVSAPFEDSGASGINGGPDDNAMFQAGAVYVFECDGVPVPYCTAKTSSAGCLAAIGVSGPGQPVSLAGDYSVTASGVQELKNGLIFASLSGAAAIPFNGGTLCMNPPTRRGPVAASGGANPAGCNGSFATVVNDQVIPVGLDAGSGNTGWYQYWYRDPQNGAGQLGTALSDAVQLDFE